jgi:amino acid transporter
MRPGALNPRAQIYFLIFLGLLVLLAIFFGILSKKTKSLLTKTWSRLYTFSIANLVIGIFLWFFTFELLPFLSMRLWFALWLIGILSWLGIISYKLSQLPKIKEEKQKLQEYNKYIP